MVRVFPSLHHYAWGSTSAIPKFLQTEPDADGRVIAEAWWGCHGRGPAELADSQGNLLDYIAADPDAHLGARLRGQGYESLPFLVKILDIAHPLSIQVHPTTEQAQRGFAAERDLPAGADRIYADDSAKQEMLVALEPSTALVGLREPDAVLRDLQDLGVESDHPIIQALGTADEPAAVRLRRYAETVLALPRNYPLVDRIHKHGKSAVPGSSLHVVSRALDDHPGDPGAFVALAMNAVHLAPGDAIAVNPGVLHSYQYGFGLEVLANSDNVIRAGFTSKKIAIDSLMEIASFEPLEPHLMPSESDEPGISSYHDEYDNHYVVRLVRGVEVTARGPLIALALEGQVTVGDQELHQGDAVFIGHADGDQCISVENGYCAVVTVPDP